MDVEQNPVLESASYILKNNAHVRVSLEGTAKAAKLLLDKMDQQKYSPATWRTQPLHPPPDLLESKQKECLDWIFLVSALNFSFWSELEGRSTRYGVEWKKSWNDTGGEKVKWEGYWSLPAALNKALENGIPITDPSFYASQENCPDALIERVFAPAEGCAEPVPLLRERIRIMREVGKVLLEDIPGQSYLGLLKDIASNKHSGNRTLVLLNKIVGSFPLL